MTSGASGRGRGGDTGDRVRRGVSQGYEGNGKGAGSGVMGSWVRLRGRFEGKIGKSSLGEVRDESLVWR